MAKVTSGGLRERVAEGDSHERRGAWRGDDDGEDSGEEAAGVALLCGERATSAGEREADFELARRARDRGRRAARPSARERSATGTGIPSRAWRAGGAQTEQQRDQRPEGNENAGGVDEAVRAELVALLVAGLHEREALEKEHREDAGHEVEQQAAKKGQPDGPEEAGAFSEVAGFACGGSIAGFGVVEDGEVAG